MLLPSCVHAPRGALGPIVMAAPTCAPPGPCLHAAAPASWPAALLHIRAAISISGSSRATRCSALSAQGPLQLRGVRQHLCASPPGGCCWCCGSGVAERRAQGTCSQQCQHTGARTLRPRVHAHAMTTHRHKPPLRFGDAELAPDKFAQVDAALDRQVGGAAACAACTGRRAPGAGLRTRCTHARPLPAIKEPLDEEEQEQLVQEFERLQLEQTRTYRVRGAARAHARTTRMQPRACARQQPAYALWPTACGTTHSARPSRPARAPRAPAVCVWPRGPRAVRLLRMGHVGAAQPPVRADVHGRAARGCALQRAGACLCACVRALLTRARGCGLLEG